MSHRTLWRIECSADATRIAYDRLAAGLHLHIIHSPVTTVTMRIGDQQRCYVVLDGCDGCVGDRCRIGCPAALFRRLFGDCVTGADLCAVAPPQGLARRPYTRGIFAWPQPHAEPIDSSLLQEWADARMLVHWRRYGASICSSLLLLTSADGPEAASTIRARHWRTCALPSPVEARWGQAALPPALPFGAPWRKPLFLLLPALHDCEQPVAVEPGGTSELVGGSTQP